MGVTPGFKQTAAGVIPDEWQAKRLGEIGSVVRGGSPRPAGDPRYFSGTFTPWLTVAALTNIPDHQLRVTETASGLTEEGSKRSRTLVEGTVIIANSGATLGVAKLLGITCCANDGIAAITNQRSGDKAFVCYYINTQTMHLRAVIATGNGQPNLNTALIREIPIPFPPVPEQRAIAEALSDVDALLGALDRLIAKKRDLKHAAMQQLLTGQTRLPGFHGEWEVKRLASVCTMKSGEGITSADIDDFSKYPCYGGNGLRGFAARFTHIGGYALIGRQGALCGNVLGVEGTFFASEHAIIVTASPQTDIRWLTAVLKEMRLNQYSESSAQPGLSVGKLLHLEVAVPPSKGEQAAIAEVLGEMDAELTTLDQRRSKTRALKQAMMQELLTGRTRLV